MNSLPKNGQFGGLFGRGHLTDIDFRFGVCLAPFSPGRPFEAVKIVSDFRAEFLGGTFARVLKVKRIVRFQEHFSHVSTQINLQGFATFFVGVNLGAVGAIAVRDGDGYVADQIIDDMAAKRMKG